ncbi:calcium-dependent protein kinase 24-like [Impatiens glandulifera]|uniref:calcium-dependent protein kinase 24-like n=1 Tax=Impatiens glandulifera TaxID=253017 RepID=UPI001FB0A3A2|nr:calcium-dependent protein kinase 24-like [Impatiens glandulifera]
MTSVIGHGSGATLGAIWMRSRSGSMPYGLQSMQSEAQVDQARHENDSGVRGRVLAELKFDFNFSKVKTADNLPDEQVDGLKQMFHMMDIDKNGHLCLEELKDGLQMIGHNVPDNEVHMLMEAADIDGNRMLNCEEFVTMSVHLKRINNNDDEEQFQLAFKCFDKNGCGYIEFEELRQGLLEDNLVSSINDQVIRDIIFDVDLDKDARISYEEFRTMMTTGVE